MTGRNRGKFRPGESFNDWYDRQSKTTSRLGRITLSLCALVVIAGLIALVVAR